MLGSFEIQLIVGPSLGEENRLRKYDHNGYFCGLFMGAVDNSVYIASNVRMIDE